VQWAHDGLGSGWTVVPCGWISIGALEPQFWACLLDLLDLSPSEIGDRADPTTWPAMRQTLATVFKSQTRAHWCALLEGTDACFAPVLSPAEATEHAHMSARGLFAPGGPDQPMPAPRFERADTPLPSPPPNPGQHTLDILRDAGLSDAEIETLTASGVVQNANTP